MMKERRRTMITMILIILLLVTFFRALFFVIGHAIGILGFIAGVILLPVIVIVMALSGLAVGGIILLAAALIGSFVVDLLADPA